jgi:hypothetical protein
MKGCSSLMVFVLGDFNAMLFLTVLGFELKACTLSHSTSPFL